MTSDSLCCQSLYFLPVQLGSSAVVLGVGSVGCAPMLTEESHLGRLQKSKEIKHGWETTQVSSHVLPSGTHCAGVPSHLHTPQLEPGPGKIQFSGSGSHTETDTYISI